MVEVFAHHTKAAGSIPNISAICETLPAVVLMEFCLKLVGNYFISFCLLPCGLLFIVTG